MAKSLRTACAYLSVLVTVEFTLMHWHYLALRIKARWLSWDTPKHLNEYFHKTESSGFILRESMTAIMLYPLHPREREQQN